VGACTSWARSSRAGSTRRRRRFIDRRLQLDQSSWLFVVGVTNSGTTVLTRLLEQHPQISGLPKEGQFLSHALPRPDDAGDGRLWALNPQRYRWAEADDPGPAMRCMFDWSWHYTNAPAVLVEKSPPNLLRMRWLQANFAPARFIVISRNPYAACEGICRRRPDCTIEQAAEQWRCAHEFMFEDLPHLQRVTRITYEQLCDEPMQTLRELETFLELGQPFEPSVIESTFTFRPSEYRNTKLTNYNMRSIERLTEDEIATITNVAGQMMDKLGYEPIERPAAHHD